jgi:NAD(P)-dependent dehydrogenase (short-subunit alcohol dehydrogenase family)
MKVALVTGASSGIGAAIARRMLAEGYVVHVAARRLDRMAALKRLGARPIALDLTDEASICAAAQSVLGQSGRLDALVNNAGYGAYGALEEVPIEEGRRQFEVNLFGLARLTQLCLPAMREQGAGRIVNVSSIGGRIHEPLGAWYHATKFAVEGLSDCLRMELAPFGIDVVVVQPGSIRTEWAGIARHAVLAQSGQGPYAEQARLTAGLLAGAERTGGSPPEVVADAVLAALRARRPRTRYIVGGGARPLLALRWLLGDRSFDAVMRIATRQVAKAEARRRKGVGAAVTETG